MPALPPYSDIRVPDSFLFWLEQVRELLRPTPIQREGTGSPEGVLTARRGVHYYRTDGVSGTLLYVKTTTTGNTGWVAYG